MTTYRIGPEEALYYAYRPPKSTDGVTFVFFNALTGDTSLWEAVIGPRLRKAGHGTLVYNYRGQTDSPFKPDTRLDEDRIEADALALLSEAMPVNPVFVGLSIGGLFAARVFLAGAGAKGLVLINTLRKDGPRLKWIGDALVRAVETGGLDLFRDLFMPLLVNEDWLAQNRSNFLLTDPSYSPLTPENGSYKLLSEAGRSADWDLDYEKLDLPVLVMTGLQDHVFLEPAVVRECFSRLPDGRRVDLPDAGHLIPAERPEALADALLAFAKEM